MTRLIAKAFCRHLVRWAERMEPELERLPADEWERGYLRARQDVCAMLGVKESQWP